MMDSVLQLLSNSRLAKQCRVYFHACAQALKSQRNLVHYYSSTSCIITSAEYWLWVISLLLKLPMVLFLLQCCLLQLKLKIYLRKSLGLNKSPKKTANTLFHLEIFGLQLTAKAYRHTSRVNFFFLMCFELPTISLMPI